MGGLNRRLAISIALIAAFLIGGAFSAPTLADVLKDVRVANIPLPVTSSDVTQELVKVNLDQTQQHYSSDTIDVTHAKQIRLNAFMECLTACPSGTQIFLTISEVGNNNSYIVDQIVNPASEFTSKLYETPGVGWRLTLASSPNCQCAAAIVSLFSRSN
jgi:hypothetical protein